MPNSGTVVAQAPNIVTFQEIRRDPEEFQKKQQHSGQASKVSFTHSFGIQPRYQ